jgi:hypothetical protein
VSAFALPPALSAKGDPALIAADEQHFARIASTLAQSIASLEDRLATFLAARAESGGEVVERDMEVRRLTARLRILKRYGLDLCIGRMVGTETVYIGRQGLTDADGERLLLDWRSPAAEPFFGATHANPMGLESRRRYRWSGGLVSDYWDEVYTPDAIEGTAALDDQSAFIASLGASRTPRMRDVLSTIQADQDAIIRAGSRGALVVDGGPGTGKTVVALHRAAYLLYSEPQLSRGGMLFVGPTPAYLAYVGDILPSLGEESVQLATLRDLVPEGAHAEVELSALKSSAAMTRVIDAAVRIYERPPTAPLVIETLEGEATLDAEDWAEAFAAAEPGATHNEAREQIWQALLEIVGEPSAELQSVFNRAWPLLDATEVVAALWSKPAYLQRSAPWLSAAEVSSLQRDDPTAWTTADLPILDYARSRIGDPHEQRRSQQRAAVIASERERIRLVVDDLIASESFDEVWMLKEQAMQDTLIDTAALPSVSADPLAGPFAHIVIDEAQELTDAEWQLLLRRCPSRSLTIVGDRAQARQGFRESWAERLARVGIDSVEVATLTVNYRTPSEVMAVAEPVIRAALPDANVPQSVRSSGVEVAYGSIHELEPVLASQTEGVSVVIDDHPEATKGLEFDLVVLIDPQRWSATDRYVAMTRATQRLVILTRE